MQTSAKVLTRSSTESVLGKMHILLGVQSLVIVLLSINRLSSLTTGYVAPNEFCAGSI